MCGVGRQTEKGNNTVTEPSKPAPNPNIILTQIRNFAKKAREGTEVRRSERELRWKFEQLDQLLSSGEHALPNDWVSTPEELRILTTTEVHAAYVMLRYCPGGVDVNVGLLQTLGVGQDIIAAAHDQLIAQIQAAGIETLNKLGYGGEDSAG